MDPRRVLPVLTALACACVVATVVVSLSGPADRPARERRPASAAASSAPGPSSVLAAWDARRSAAWAAGDREALRGLYAAGSRTGAADVRLLGHYLRRGLTVAGLHTQVLALAVVEQSPRRLVLRVTDRVVGGRAVGGTTPVALPTDRASTRWVVLVRRPDPGEEWLVVEARDQARPAARTSRTSSSSKS